MKIKFLGAARTVTGSMHLFESSGRRILLDCGLYQGSRREAFERNKTLPFDASALDAVVLSHAHIDHSGNLPNLVKSGFRGRIHATAATRDLCALMLADSAHIQQKDAQYLSERKRTFIEPLYDADDVAATMRLFATEAPGTPFRAGVAFEASFHEAGHMLGSSGVSVEAMEDGRTVRIGFSGDVGHEGDPLLPSPKPLPDPDVLILESTYGDRRHEAAGERKEKLLEVVRRTADRGGRLVIPAFSVGRTQLLVYTLNELFNERRLPPIPIFVDSPLSVNVTDVFRAHTDILDPAIRASLQRDPDPFGFARLTYIRSVEESKALNARPGPFAVISASGMCESGRVLHHIKNAIADPRNTLLIAGFQAPHTLGRRLVERIPQVRILGGEHPLRAEVVTLNSFSAHADQGELVAHATACNPKSRLRRIFLVHGEEKAAAALTGALSRAGLPPAHYPARGEEAGI